MLAAPPSPCSKSSRRPPSACERTAAELPELQALFDANPEYFISVSGQPPGRSEARDEYDEVDTSAANVKPFSAVAGLTVEAISP